MMDWIFIQPNTSLQTPFSPSASVFHFSWVVREFGMGNYIRKGMGNSWKHWLYTRFWGFIRRNLIGIAWREMATESSFRLILTFSIPSLLAFCYYSDFCCCFFHRPRHQTVSIFNSILIIFNKRKTKKQNENWLNDYWFSGAELEPLQYRRANRPEIGITSEIMSESSKVSEFPTKRNKKRN